MRRLIRFSAGLVLVVMWALAVLGGFEPEQPGRATYDPCSVTYFDSDPMCLEHP